MLRGIRPSFEVVKEGRILNSGLVGVIAIPRSGRADKLLLSTVD